MKKLGHFWFAPRILLILLAALLIGGIIFVGACVGYGRHSSILWGTMKK